MKNFLESIHDDREPDQRQIHETLSWKIMVVDDDVFVHEMTRYVLADVMFEGRPIEILSAYSAAEARRMLQGQTEVAVMLLDVVMESETAGLDLIPFIRRELQNNSIQIVVRTGQAGRLEERDIVNQYEINDYKTKNDLTAQKLHTSLICGLRTYRIIRQFESIREHYNKEGLDT